MLPQFKKGCLIMVKLIYSTMIFSKLPRNSRGYDSLFEFLDGVRSSEPSSAEETGRRMASILSQLNIMRFLNQKSSQSTSIIGLAHRQNQTTQHHVLTLKINPQLCVLLCVYVVSEL